MTTTTVIDYVLGRLHDIGVTDIFGVPGDFAFPVQDAIVAHPDINWIGSCNELNAAYAADGYARIRGVGAVSTTYGVGELSAISAVAGSYAEHLPVFHLTGMPNLATQADRALVHHTLGNGEFELFRRMADIVVGASAIITPANVVFESRHRARRHPRRACAVSSMSGSQCGVLPARTGRAPTVPILGRTV